MSNVISDKGRSFGSWFHHKFMTREGLIGTYNYAYLFTPKLPFMKQKPIVQPFFGLDDEIPVLLAFLLGLQHALAMLAGVITPPMIIASSAHLDAINQQYLVSVSLIVSGIVTIVQVSRISIYKTNYKIGTGLISVVGTSFGTITVTSKAFPLMYAQGLCKYDDAGNPLPCPDGYGAIIGTGSVCALLEILISLLPAKILRKIFPPMVTGSLVLLIGISLVSSGFSDFAGGSGCKGSICPSQGGPQAAPWGSAKFIGLGFLVFVSIIFCEKWGAPIMKSCAVIIGLLIGCIVASACGYFSDANIKASPSGTFIWVHTYKLTVYGPAVLPLLACFLVAAMEATGDFTASCDVSRVPVEGPDFDSRVQGGLLCDGLGAIFAGLATLTPISTFAQNNGVISITKCANRGAGYFCCFFLILMGIVSKFAAALIAIPKPVLGGMTSFLFCSVAVTGLAIIGKCSFTRRDRFVLTAGLLPGFGAILVPNWFSYVFTYTGNNTKLQGFLNAIVLVMETGYAVTAVITITLNLTLPQEEEEELLFDNDEELVAYVSRQTARTNHTNDESSDDYLKTSEVIKVDQVK